MYSVNHPITPVCKLLNMQTETFSHRPLPLPLQKLIGFARITEVVLGSPGDSYSISSMTCYAADYSPSDGDAL